MLVEIFKMYKFCGIATPPLHKLNNLYKLINMLDSNNYTAHNYTANKHIIKCNIGAAHIILWNYLLVN